MQNTIESTLRAETALIAPKRLATILGMHYQTLYAHIREGNIPYLRVGARIKFDGPTVADWLQRRTVAAR